jgi:hypothetical protein
MARHGMVDTRPNRTDRLNRPNALCSYSPRVQVPHLTIYSMSSVRRRDSERVTVLLYDDVGWVRLAFWGGPCPLSGLID